MRLPARILSSLPVRGWRTLRAARLASRKLPKPVTENVPSRLSCFRMVSNTTSTTARAARPSGHPPFLLHGFDQDCLAHRSPPAPPDFDPSILGDKRGANNPANRAK